MGSNKLYLCLLLISISGKAQETVTPTLNIGDYAPILQIREWLKGESVQEYEKGKVYVIEFWATWCAPCKVAMPHLSLLAQEYKKDIIIIGVDVMEEKSMDLAKLKMFVDSMGPRMNYKVAIHDNNYKNWLEISGEQPRFGIPRTFIIDREGKLAWIGHPSKLKQVLSKILDNNWSIEEYKSQRNLNRYLYQKEDSLNYELIQYRETPFRAGKPNLALIAINDIIKNEPELRYAPRIAFHTFSALLHIDMQKAYEFGKMAISNPSELHDSPAYTIAGCIETYSDKLQFSSDIFKLGAESYQNVIDEIPYPELANIPKLYNKIAEWYWRANEKEKAIDAQLKAVEELKRRKGSSKEDLSLYEARLKRYKAK